MNTARLYVDGLGVFEGKSIGSKTFSNGELVFTTSPSGYIKSITDPSYTGQILVFSFPYIGSYGLEEIGESSRPRVRGVVVNHIPEHYRESFSSYLEKWGIPGIILPETRKIIDHIRTSGNKLASFAKKEFSDPYISNLVDENLQGSTSSDGNILLVDLGYKGNILRFLEWANVSIVPYYAFKQEDAERYDGILISNGPGDPTHPSLSNFVKNIKYLTGRKPLLGICLGHQLLSISIGMKTEKMKFGHRSINHPVIDLSTGRIGVTTHNHGFAVRFGEDKGAIERYRSMNDGTNEGIEGKKFLTVQFHPEGGPGPSDELEVFKEFRRVVHES
ncbi:MAG: carbamoyl phosphate synthase small subunit [Thermoplasmatales archaeon]